jgi:CheY-like chemotaxis protein
MASIPRILAVDHTDEIANILRGAMTLMDRRFILVEVPAAEDALEELRNSRINLLVSAYSLPDMNGLDLAARAIRESAGTPVIILASPDDPEVDPAQLTNQPYTYLARPVGEAFLRALRVGLDGEAAVSVQEGSSSGGSTALELGPVPSINEQMLRDQLLLMMRDTVAIGGFIANRMGKVIYAEGVTGYFDIDVCAALLAPQFAQTIYFREMVGGNAWTLNYFDGDAYDLFALALGLHYFAVLIFDGSKRPQFGPVTNFGRKGADIIIESLGVDAWTFRRQAAKAATQTMHALRLEAEKPAPSVEEPAAPAKAKLKASPPAHTEETQPVQPVTAPQTPDLNLEPIENLDVDALFNQNVDEAAFDSLFSEDDMDLKPSLFGNEDSVSFNEAMDMGILDE